MITTPEQLVAFLAPVDTVADAVQLRRGPYAHRACVSVRTDAEGFAFFDSSCASSSDYPIETITLVLRDGSTRELERSKPTDGKPQCTPHP